MKRAAVDIERHVIRGMQEAGNSPFEAVFGLAWKRVHMESQIVVKTVRTTTWRPSDPPAPAHRPTFLCRVFPSQQAPFWRTSDQASPAQQPVFFCRAFPTQLSAKLFSDELSAERLQASFLLQSVSLPVYSSCMSCRTGVSNGVSFGGVLC